MKDGVKCPLQANQVGRSNISTIHSAALEIYHETFDHKEFVLHQSEVLPLHPKWNA